MSFPLSKVAWPVGRTGLQEIDGGTREIFDPSRSRKRYSDGYAVAAKSIALPSKVIFLQ
jgi:hypothetical protein